MNEETTNASVVNADVQSTESEQKDVAKTETKGKDEQSTAVTEDKTVIDTPTTQADKTADNASKDQTQTDTSKPATPNKPAKTKPADPQPTAPKEPTAPTTSVKPDPTPTPERPKKLADVVPTTLVWISGVVGSHQIDCAGPIELPFKLDKPEWPYTTVAPNPAYTNQVFDYDNDAWVATDAKSQGQQLTDLIKKVNDLQEDSASHEKSADQSQKMSMQLTQSMILITNKLTMMEGKLDTLLNTKEKDGDK